MLQCDRNDDAVQSHPQIFLSLFGRNSYGASLTLEPIGSSLVNTARQTYGLVYISYESGKLISLVSSLWERQHEVIAVYVSMPDAKHAKFLSLKLLWTELK